MGSFDKAVRASDLNEDRFIGKENQEDFNSKVRFEEEPTLQFSNI